jgi:hypothetical protein
MEEEREKLRNQETNLERRMGRKKECVQTITGSKKVKRDKGREE